MSILSVGFEKWCVTGNMTVFLKLSNRPQTTGDTEEPGNRADEKLEISAVCEINAKRWLQDGFTPFLCRNNNTVWSSFWMNSILIIQKSKLKERSDRTRQTRIQSLQTLLSRRLIILDYSRHSLRLRKKTTQMPAHFLNRYFSTHSFHIDFHPRPLFIFSLSL